MTTPPWYCCTVTSAASWEVVKGFCASPTGCAPSAPKASCATRSICCATVSGVGSAEGLSVGLATGSVEATTGDSGLSAWAVAADASGALEPSTA